MADMLYLNIWLAVKDPADVEKVRGLLGEQARLSRQEPGCERFEVYQSNNDPTRFLLTERWRSQVSQTQRHNLCRGDGAQ